VGPTYQKPDVPIPSVYKELPPVAVEAPSGWKTARPNDGAPRGQWWEVFQEPQVHALIAQVTISNHNIAIAEAQFRSARAAIYVSRAALFPTITSNVVVSGTGGVFPHHHLKRCHRAGKHPLE
jgi:outer membrane protein TolC